MSQCFRLYSIRFIEIAAVLFLCTQSSFSQPPAKAATNAFIITRMADKYHIQPRVLNDSFSLDFFNQFLKQLDKEKIYFNKDDINQLAVYKLQLDDQVKQKKNNFLSLITSLYTKRLNQVDTIIDAIAKKPFNFSAAEKFSVEEDTAYPADIVAMHYKLYKKIKMQVLDDLLDLNDDLSLKTPARQKQILDSAQQFYQKKTQSVYKRNIKRILQSPGGAEQYVANVYCKALASSYDPHTEFFPLTEEENFESELGNQRFRFGFAIKEDNGAGGVIINDLEPGSPAYKCGLLNKGDKFETLQWQGQNAIDVSDADGEELGEILSQSNHDKITITVKKADGTLRTVTLMKEQQEATDDTKVKSFLLQGSKTFGYIYLPAFYNNWEDETAGDNGCANDVAKEIIKLKKENMQGLILDLRYNGGGSLQEAVELAGIFIDAGPVEQIKRSGDAKVITLKDVNRGTIYDGPLLILVNGYTASASELVAGALQDYNRALIVGSSTYGKATGQIVLPLDTTVSEQSSNQKQADDYLKITIEKLYRITGTSAQFKGVQPDVVLPDFLEADPQKEAGEPFALLPANTDANKYFQPYPAMQLSALQSMAKHDADTMNYFKSLNKYIQQYKLLNAPADVSLNWKDAVAEHSDSLNTGFDTMQYNTNYSIQNNAYDMERFSNDPSSKELYNSITNYLTHDPYIKISYDLLTKMSK